MGGEELRHLHGILTVALHAQLEGFESQVRQPGIEWAGDASQDLDEGVQRFVDVVWVPADHRPAGQGAVPGEELGGGVHHDIRPQAERSLAVGGGKGVIHRQPGAMTVGKLGHGFQVNHCHGRVGGCLGIRQFCPRVGCERLLPSPLGSMSRTHATWIPRLGAISFRKVNVAL